MYRVRTLVARALLIGTVRSGAIVSPARVRLAFRVAR